MNLTLQENSHFYWCWSLSFLFIGQLTDNITLFTYNPGENTSTFSNASFVPIFLDEPIDFGSDELRTAAELACQGDVNCLFDIASTGDVSVGASTKEVSVQIESESQALGEKLIFSLFSCEGMVDVIISREANVYHIHRLMFFF